MFLVAVVTALIVISLWIGITIVLPPGETPQNPSSPLPSVSSATSSPPEIPIETPTPAEMEPPVIPNACYDKITIREKGRVYLFKSRVPLETGVNPKVFADLPTYRVWAEQMLGEGFRCPVLFYDPNAPPFVHPEEEYPPEVAMVRSAVKEGEAYRKEIEVEFNPRNPPFVITDGTVKVDRDAKSGYIRSAMTEPVRFIPNDSVDDPSYAEAVGKPSKVHREDYVTRSRRDAMGLGADQPLPVPPRSIRDVPEWKVRGLLASAEPELAGASLRRTGISQYEVESIPSREEREREREVVQGWSGSFSDSPMPLDLLAYGGTVVPVKNVRRLFQ